MVKGSGGKSSGKTTHATRMSKSVVTATRELVLARRVEDNIHTYKGAPGDTEIILRKLEKDSGFSAMRKALEHEGDRLEQKAEQIRDAKLAEAHHVCKEKTDALQQVLVKEGIVAEKPQITTVATAVEQDPQNFNKYLKGRDIEVHVEGKVLAFQKGPLERVGAPGKVTISPGIAARLQSAVKSKK
jgi:hypothetical protein